MRLMQGQVRAGELREDKAKQRFDVVVHVCSCVCSCLRVHMCVCAFIGIIAVSCLAKMREGACKSERGRERERERERRAKGSGIPSTVSVSYGGL